MLGVELFYMGDGAAEPLIINEIAPRVHNSGHWTLDACSVSQFENHIRAVAGWPLGSTDRHSDAVMTNIIGPEADQWAAQGSRGRGLPASLRQGPGAPRPQDGPCHQAVAAGKSRLDAAQPVHGG